MSTTIDEAQVEDLLADVADDTDTPAPAEPEPEPEVDLPSLGLLVAIATVMEEQVKSGKDFLRGQALAAMLKKYRTLGMKQLAVKGPDGETIATITLPESSDKAVVTDKEQFTAWVEENHPTEVEYTASVRPSFQSVLLEKEVTLDTATGAVIDANGEVIPGVTAKKGGDPTFVQTKFIKPTKTKPVDGRKIALDLLNGVDLFSLNERIDKALPGADTAVIEGELADGGEG
jgi:hypothetical protein